MRLRNVKNKAEIMNDSNYLVKDNFAWKGKWKKLFKNNNPIYIEIGMGKGQFIIENAKKYPNINFIGIEKYDSVIAKALKKIPEGLDNLVMLRCNALDIDQVFDKETNSLRDAEYRDFVVLLDRGRDFDLYKKIFEYLQIPLTIYKDESLNEVNNSVIVSVEGEVTSTKSDKVYELRTGR